MTKPGKRTGSLRRLPQEEASSAAGGWVDKSFPVDAVNAALDSAAVTLSQATLGAFHSFLGGRLGMYRSREESRDDLLSVAQEQALVDELIEHMGEVERRLEHLPSRVRHHASTVTWKRHGQTYGEFVRERIAGLKQVFDVLTLAERKLDPERNQPGAKGKPHRDWLLFEVAGWLHRSGVKKTKSAEAAGAVLVAAGIDAPLSTRDAARIIRRMASQVAGEE